MKRPIRLTHFISSLERGGAQAVLYDLIMHMDPTLFTHTVIYIHEGPYVQMLQEVGIPVHQVKGLFFQYDPVFFIRLFFCIKQMQPDCLHTLLWMANNAGRIVARLRGIPCVSVLHNNLDQDGVIRNAIDRITFVCTDELVAVSAGVAHSLQQRTSWFPARIAKTPVQVIHNGIDVEHVANKALISGIDRMQLGLCAEHFIIGAVGRLVPVKNYRLLLESVALIYRTHPQVRLVLVGQGPQKEMLANHAQTLGIEQIVLFVEGQPAYGYYPLFDCFIQTSDKEGVSIALLEAMSFGCVCIVTSVTPDHPVLCSEKNGIVVSAGNCQQIVDAVDDIITNHVYRQCLGYNARVTVKKNFDIKLMTTAYERLFLKQCRSYGHYCDKK